MIPAPFESFFETVSFIYREYKRNNFIIPYNPLPPISSMKFEQKIGEIPGKTRKKNSNMNRKKKTPATRRFYYKPTKNKDKNDSNILKNRKDLFTEITDSELLQPLRQKAGKPKLFINTNANGLEEDINSSEKNFKPYNFTTDTGLPGNNNAIESVNNLFRHLLEPNTKPQLKEKWKRKHFMRKGFLLPQNKSLDENGEEEVNDENNRPNLQYNVSVLQNEVGDFLNPVVDFRKFPNQNLDSLNDVLHGVMGDERHKNIDDEIIEIGGDETDEPPPMDDISSNANDVNTNTGAEIDVDGKDNLKPTSTEISDGKTSDGETPAILLALNKKNPKEKFKPEKSKVSAIDKISLAILLELNKMKDEEDDEEDIKIPNIIADNTSDTAPIAKIETKNENPKVIVDNENTSIDKMSLAILLELNKMKDEEDEEDEDNQDSDEEDEEDEEDEDNQDSDKESGEESDKESDEESDKESDEESDKESGEESDKESDEESKENKEEIEDLDELTLAILLSVIKSKKTKVAVP